MTSKRYSFAINVLILLNCCFCTAQCASTAPTKDSSTSSPTNTTITTAASKPTDTTITSTPSTTTTKTTTTTPTVSTTVEPSAKLGADCSSRNTTWCQKYITGSASCNSTTNLCSCDPGHWRKNSSKCLTATILKPVSLIVNDTDITATSLVIQWQMSDQSVSWKFNVSCSGVQSSHQRTQTNLTNTTASFTSLTSGDEYNISVTAYFTNDNGDMFDGTQTKKQAIDPAQPGPLDLGASNLTAPNITLKWGASSGYVEKYKIRITGHNPMTSYDTETFFPGLESGTQYEVRITAENNGRSSQERLENITTDSKPPGPPEGLTLSSKDKTSVTVTWNETTKPNGVLSGYFVCSREKVYSDEAFMPQNCSQIPRSTQHTFQPLTPGGYYEFEIYSVNTDYNGTESANLTGIRTSEDVPGKVVGLNVDINNLSFYVAWQRPSEPNGDITEYVIDWRSDVVQCSDCLKTANVSSCSLQISSNCSTTSGDSIETNQKQMNYTITGLSPFTNYTVTVTPYTSIGPGENDSRTTRTSVVAPDPVTNVTTTVLNSTSVMVNWTIPARNPGPVNYTVFSDDRIGMTGPLTSPGCTAEANFPGYGTSSCIVTGLEEYWVYQFIVIASNEAGDSGPTYSDNTTTLEGIPEVVQDWTVTLYNSSAVNCDATKVRYQWTEPRRLDRNAKIVAYIITDMTQNNRDVTYAVENPNPYTFFDRVFSEEITGLKANTAYQKKLEAQTEGGELGASYSKHFTTNICAPPPWPNSATIDENPKKKSTRSFTVTLHRDFFVNGQQGEIKETGLIISKQNYSIEIKTAKQNFWRTAKEGDFQTLYAVRFTVPNTSRFEVIVGQNETCSADKQYTAECNGQLPPSRTFYVMAYACTDADKCTGSPFYGAYTTADVPVQEPQSSNVGGAVGGALVAVGAALFVVAIVIMQRRGTIDLRKYCPGGSGHGPRDPDLDPVIGTKRPVRFSGFENYVNELHKDTNLLFSAQYEDIQKYSKLLYDSFTTDNANLEENKAKNRWVNILPFDHSRVKLQPLDDDDPTSDYINANYIPGIQHQRDYIATQGPLPGTIDDFWRMVWEHNIAVIVMLTQCKEGNRVKCEPYWPNEIHEPKQYGEVVVDPVSISTLNKYNITIFNVSVNDVKRSVYHFHYLEFPDMSANVEYDVFLEFLQVVRSHIPRNIDSPLIVHCSAGVGRTGTFIILDRLQQTLSRRDFKWEDTVDIFDMVIGMRHNRTNMVQTESQYIMIHDCLCKMLENKKRSTELSLEDETPYVNQAYDPSPEVLYENLKGNEMKTDL